MSNWIVTLGGLLLFGIIAWYFWVLKKGRTFATVGPSGFQEIAIRVKNGYNPARIMVQSGKPIRFFFMREENDPCTEMIVFPDFQKSAMLPIGKKVIIDLPPMKVGIYEFTCQMGMYRGSIIVKGDK